MLLGYTAPSMLLYQQGYNRTQRMRRQLPDALDLLSISVEAGLSFNSALAQVAQNTTGPLAVANAGDRTFVAAGPLATGSKPWHVVPADLDSDGDLDLGVTNFGDATLSMFLNDGEGSFGPHKQQAAGPGPRSLAAGDLDVDDAIVHPIKAHGLPQDLAECSR